MGGKKDKGKKLGRNESEEQQIIIGDPTVTAGKNQESVSTLKDMYGIFKIRDVEIPA